MTAHPTAQPPAAARESFPASLVEAGIDPAVAEEIERRIEIVETVEADDESRRALSGREIAVFTLATALIVGVGLVLVVL